MGLVDVNDPRFAWLYLPEKEEEEERQIKVRSGRKNWRCSRRRGLSTRCSSRVKRQQTGIDGVREHSSQHCLPQSSRR